MMLLKDYLPNINKKFRNLNFSGLAFNSKEVKKIPLRKEKKSDHLFNEIRNLNILKNDELDFIILDDAFQHRKLKTTLNIMLSSFSKPFYNDYIFPVGDLRESRSSYKRANIIIISK